MATKYKLKLDKLNFISAVDRPAQETATVRLIKRADGHPHFEGVANVVKTSDELGLVFLWAFTCEQDGKPYHDLQGDAIDHDFIKAAADFMSGAGLSDEMHDREPDGKVVFAMPMTPEIAAAYGVTTKTTGLMAALKPSPEVFAKFKSGEYTGASIDGDGWRTAVKAVAKAALAGAIKMGIAKLALVGEERIVKLAVLTSEVDGHQHTLALEDPGCEWLSGGFFTSYQTMAGAEYDHCHGWTYDAESGAITIGQDSDHTHTIADVVPPAILAVASARAAVAALRAQLDAGAAAGAVLDAAAEAVAGGASVAVTIAARAPSTNSTPSPAPAIVASQQESKPMPLLMKHLAVLAACSAPMQAYATSLDEPGAVAFLEKSAGDRETILKSNLDADPIVYTTTAGEPIRKSAGDLAVRLAKQLDSQAVELAAQRTEVEKSSAVAKRAQLEKRAAAELVGVCKTLDAKVWLLGAIDGAPEDIRKALTEDIAGLKAMAKSYTVPRGTDEHNFDDTSPVTKASTYSKLEKGLTEFATKTSIPLTKMWTEALDKFVATPEGKALADAYEQAKSTAA